MTGEGKKAFEAFYEYRNLGFDRSHQKVAKILGKSTAIVSRWSSSNNWVKRCEEWDLEQDRIAQREMQKEIGKMRNRHANMANAMLIKAAQALKSIPEYEIKASDISRMVEVASKLERISRGDIGEVVEERSGGDAIQAVQVYIPDNGRDTHNDDDNEI